MIQKRAAVTEAERALAGAEDPEGADNEVAATATEVTCARSRLGGGVPMHTSTQARKPIAGCSSLKGWTSTRAVTKQPHNNPQTQHRMLKRIQSLVRLFYCTLTSLADRARGPGPLSRSCSTNTGCHAVMRNIVIQLIRRLPRD